MDLADQKELMSCIAADLKMLAMKTDLMDMEECEKYISDFNIFLRNDYIKAISIVIANGDNVPIKAKKYIVQNNTNRQQSDRPGNNNWDEIDGNRLHCVISYSDKWISLDNNEKDKIKKDMKIPWSPTNLDTEFSALRGNNDKQYSARISSIHRTSYE